MTRELLFSVTKKDFVITWFSGSGAGGQYRNKHQNCCRIKHPDSGVIVTGQDERSQQANLKKAFKRLTEHPKFKTWLRIETSKRVVNKEKFERKLNNTVDAAMREENLKIEYVGGKV
jgi:protein subunit release factor A